jgi:plasmid stability protein
MIQIRNVPPEIHRALKARAALAGKSMSEMILEELRAMLSLPSERELRERLDHAEPFAMKKSSAGLIRRERDAA